MTLEKLYPDYAGTPQDSEIAASHSIYSFWATITIKIFLIQISPLFPSYH